MNREVKIMTTQTNAKKFNASKATLVEINRELKRIASRKCRANSPKEKEQYEIQYNKLAEIKAKRFKSVKPKTYMSYTEEEIKALNLENTIKAIKSLQSTRCLYPNRKAEVLKVEAKFQEHKSYLNELAQFESLKAKFSK